MEQLGSLDDALSQLFGHGFNREANDLLSQVVVVVVLWNWTALAECMFKSDETWDTFTIGEE
jgi:hypothetical protein